MFTSPFASGNIEVLGETKLTVSLGASYMLSVHVFLGEFFYFQACTETKYKHCTFIPGNRYCAALDISLLRCARYQVVRTLEEKFHTYAPPAIILFRPGNDDVLFNI